MEFEAANPAFGGWPFGRRIVAGFQRGCLSQVNSAKAVPWTSCISPFPGHPRPCPCPSGIVFDITGTSRGLMNVNAGKEALPYFLRMLWAASAQEDEPMPEFPPELGQCEPLQQQYIMAWIWALAKDYTIIGRWGGPELAV